MRKTNDTPANAMRVVQPAVTLEINHLGTGQGYNMGEDLFGRVLKTIDRTSVCITTKIAHMNKPPGSSPSCNV